MLAAKKAISPNNSVKNCAVVLKADNLLLAVNVELDANAVTEACGLRRLAYGQAASCLPAELAVKRFYSYGDGSALCLCKDGNLYVVESSETTAALVGESDLRENVCGTRFYGRDGVLAVLSSADGGLYVCKKDGAKKVENINGFSAVCAYNERLFGIRQGDDKLYFSAVGDASDFVPSVCGAGSLSLNGLYGKALRVLPVGEKLCVVREYGLSFVMAYAVQTEFSLFDRPLGIGRVYPDTVSAAGEKIFVLSDKGLYCLDNGEAKKLDVGGEIFSKDNNSAFAAFNGGNYVLAFKAVSFEEYGKPHKNDSVLIADKDGRVISVLYGADVSFVSEGNGGTFDADVCMGDGSLASLSGRGKFFGLSCEKSFELLPNVLNGGGVKTLKSVSLKTSYSLTLRIRCDGVEKFFQIRGSESVSYVTVNITGKKFSFRFFTDYEKMRVSDVNLVYTQRFKGKGED